MAFEDHDWIKVDPAESDVTQIWADVRKCFQTDMTVFIQRKMFLFSLRSVRETCRHAWVENVFFFKLRMLHMAQGLGGRGGLRVWPAASWQLSWISLNPPSLCLAACHFGIVSAIESLFNLSPSGVSEGPAPGIRSDVSSAERRVIFLTGPELLRDP